VSKSSGNLTKAFLLNNKRNPPKEGKKKLSLKKILIGYLQKPLL
jgi:hypothetical protein